MSDKVEYIYAPESKIESNRMIIYGAGKFNEDKLVIGKERAALLLIEICKFLQIDLNHER